MIPNNFNYNFSVLHLYFIFQMVIYIVCYNQEDEQNDQLSQIMFWLQFLNSAISHSSLSSSSSRSSSKWKVMIVGLRADAKHLSSRSFKQAIGAWQKQFKLPLYKEIFSVSSLTSSESVNRLLQKVEEVCEQIFQSLPIRIPSSYRDLLGWIESYNKSTVHSHQQDQHDYQENHHHQYFISINDLHSKYLSTNASFGAGTISAGMMERILRFLHAIGHVVLVDKRTVCTNPAVIPKIVANFISPEEVRIKLYKKRDIVILDDNIKCLLDIDATSDDRCNCFFLFVIFIFRIDKSQGCHRDISHVGHEHLLQVIGRKEQQDSISFSKSCIAFK